jgi:PAS domain S-box-containing protein
MITVDKKLMNNGHDQTVGTTQTSLQLLTLIMNNIPQAVFWKDRNLVYLGCNQAFAEDAGLSSPEEVVGKTDFDMPWKDQAELYRADDQQVMQTGKPKINYEEPQTTPDGSMIWLSTSKIPVFEGDQVVAVLGMYEDITARKRVEQELRDSEARYAAVVKQAKDGIVIIQDNLLKFVNQAMADMLGYTPAEMENTPVINYIAPESKALVIERIKARLEGKEVPPIYEAGLQRKDGTVVEAELSAGVIEYLGKPADVGLIRNITERKQAEERVHVSEERFRRFTEATVEGVVFHEKGKIIDANPAALAMFGLEKGADLVGRDLLEFVLPECHETVLKQMQSETVQPYEIVGSRADGSTFPLETSTRVYREGGRVIRVSSVRDITERKRIENAVQESRRLLQLVMDNIPQAVFWKDRNLVYLGCNRAFAEDAGLASPEEIIGKTDYDMPWKPEAELYRADDQKVMEAGQPKLNFEEPQTTPTGDTIWLRTNKVPMVADDGKVFAVLGMYEDVTERKQAEQELRRRVEIETILTTISSDFVSVTLDNIDQKINQALEMLGRFANSDRSYLFLLTEDRSSMDNTHEWCASGIEAHIDRLKGIPITTFPWLMERLEKLEVVNIPLVANLPPEASAEREEFQVEGIQSIIVTPIIFHGRLVGFMGFDAVSQQTSWKEDTITVLRSGGEMIITTLERIKLQQEIQAAFEQRGYQVQVSTEISQEISQAAALDDLFERVVTLTKERLGYYHTQLLRYDPTQDAVVLIAGYGETGSKMLAMGHRMEMGHGLIGTAAASGQTMMRPTLADDPDWQPNPLLPNTKGEIAVPIKLGDQVLGVLDVQSDRADAITEDDRLLLEGLCGQIAVAIEQTRLRQEMEERLQELNRLYRAMRHEGWQAFREKVDIPTSYVFDQGRLRPIQEASLAEELFAPIPLALPGGEVIGKVAVADDPQRPLTQDDIAFLEQVSEQVALALESARLFEQTQSALYESKEAQKLIRSVIDSTDDWIFVKDREHRYQLVNQGYANALHISIEDFIGKNDLELGFPEELVKGNAEKGIRGFWADDSLVMETGMPQRFPEDPATVDGQIRIFDTIKIPLRDERNNVWGVLAFARDLTERKRAEETVAKRATQLESVATVSTTASTVLDPEKLLQAVVDLTKQRFGLYHAHIYLVDEAQQTLLLATGAGEVGRKMVAEGWSISLDHDKSIVAQAARSHQSVVANDVIHDKDSMYLSNRLLPDTRSEMAIPMVVGDKLIGVFDVQSDQQDHFTQEDANIYTTLAAQVAIALQNARLYQEQAATVTQLRELDRLKSSFLANMSHELRTPLNSILGFADVMLEELDGPLTENMNNDLQLIQKNGQHLLHLINDVLDMAKIEAGRMNLSPETFRFHEILEEVTSITSPLASEKSLSLFIESDSDQEVEIFADRTRIRQVMLNLVNNAMKFTEKGKISMRTARTKQGILVTVCDTGIGIPADKLEAIFQEFTQVDSSSTRKAGGTGLGLPISRKLVEMHGGRLWAESSGIPGEGSTFYVELPLEARLDDSIEKQENK